MFAPCSWVPCVAFCWAGSVPPCDGDAPFVAFNCPCVLRGELPVVADGVFERGVLAATWVPLADGRAEGPFVWPWDWSLPDDCCVLPAEPEPEDVEDPAPDFPMPSCCTICAKLEEPPGTPVPLRRPCG